jgi:radical SAM protein with 4Fe4S-binding SPASM domain
VSINYRSIQAQIYPLKYLNSTKVLNLLKLYFSFLINRIGLNWKPRLKPSFISVEPSNFCNLQCPECPVGNGTSASFKKKMTMNFGLYTGLIDELKSSLFHVIFYFQGEPLIHNEFCEMVSYAHRSGIYTSTSTNAQFIDKELARKIVSSGLDKLIVSVDGTTQEVYEQYRVGGKLELTLQAIEHIQYWKRVQRSKTPFIELQFIVFKNNEHQIDDIKALAKSLKVDALRLKTAQLYNFENGHELIPTIEKYARYKKLKNGKVIIKSKLKNRCWRMWSGSVVSAKGEVLPCCFDKYEQHGYGNLSNQSFANSWQNQKASAFRQQIHLNRKQFEMCRNCTE